MFGGFSYDIQINTTNPEDMDNLDKLLNFDWMNHVANQMETEMAFQMERKYPKEQDRKVFRLSVIFDCSTRRSIRRNFRSSLLSSRNFGSIDFR